jgi:hypothetical protein
MPPSSRRRVTRLRSSVSTACSTTGSTLDIETLLQWALPGQSVVNR